jgi:hypothetical protein
MDIKKMQSAAIALRDNNCEENYIEHINQSCPVNVLELIAQREALMLQVEEFRRKYQREHIDTNRWKNRAELAEALIEAESKQGPATPDDIQALVDNVRRWGIENTGHEPSISCFHRSLDELVSAILVCEECDIAECRHVKNKTVKIVLQQSPAVADDKNLCALKTITDSQVAAVARAFWRRIEPFKSQYGRELPNPLPVEFMAHMATALSWLEMEQQS